MSDVLRWMCDQYRTKLHNINPEACQEIDAIMADAGQGWICDTTVIDPDELVTTKDIQDRFGISQGAIRKLVFAKKIPNRGRLGRWNIYRLGDILSARAQK